MRYLFFTLLLLTATSFAADIAPQNFNKVKLSYVYDGDTFKVYLACNYPVFCKRTPIRVKGIDTAEIKSKDDCEVTAAKKAKDFTEQFLNRGKILLRDCERDKYFRLLCNVKVRYEDKDKVMQTADLAEELLKENLATVYAGGTKQSVNWCDKTIDTSSKELK